MPERVQRKRTKGWKMPENTIYVGRPSIFGNPYKPTDDLSYELCVLLYRTMVKGIWDGPLFPRLISDAQVHRYYVAQEKWSKKFGEHPLTYIQRNLRGKNLTCWCKEGEPCHADVLLELANQRS